jgi:hypothetical protein
MPELMDHAHPHLRRNRLAVALAAVGTIVGLAACGTPATVRPVANPLPGLGRAIQDAHGAVNQSEQQAQSLGATSVTTP